MRQPLDDRSQLLTIKSLLVGNENEIGTYGVGVTLGTTSSGGGTTTPTP